MRFLLMRHAEAVPAGGNDFSRTLSERGRADAAAMGAWLRAAGIRAGTVLASPLPRAIETAGILAALLEAAVTEESRLAPGMQPDTGSALLHEYGSGDTVLVLTGHAPDLPHFAARCLGSDPGAIKMPPAAAAFLEAERPGHGGSVLRWLIHPGILPADVPPAVKK